MVRVSDELLERFKRCVYERSDLHFSSKKHAFLEKRIRERFIRSGLPDYESYYSFLMGDPSEVYSLIEDLTTNETRFFRNAAQFRALSDVVVPELVKAKNREVVSSWGKGHPVQGRHPAMSIKVWSAGCSTGEEAYSIAFTLLDIVKYPKAWDLDVLATDIKREAVVVAKSGFYSEKRIEGIGRPVMERFMEQAAGGWLVRPEARRIINFRAANIKDITGQNGGRTLGLVDENGGVAAMEVRNRFDVIFCRNVMIYFDRAAQQRLVDALYDCLRPGGYLFTGDSEPLHLFSHGFIRAEDTGSLYYRKPE
jgi:chemotaxis protein methyltransferase CheR